MGGSRLEGTDFQTFSGSGLHRIQFLCIRIGLGLKNFTVRSSLMGALLIRYEHRTGLRLDLNRTIANLVEL